MKKYPFCSVIVLNYYGEKVVSDTLDGLLGQNYPQDRYEIIVVDNNSKDKSRKILERYSEWYSNIRLFWLDENRGFSRGNNFGIKQAKGEYVILLNNDCRVNKDWLTELVKTAEKDKTIFAVNSKILLYQKFINISFKLNPKLIPVYVWLSDSKLFKEAKSKIAYLPFWKKQSPAGGEYTMCNFEAYFDAFNDKSIEITLLLNSRGFKLTKATQNDIAVFDNKAVEIIKVNVDSDDIECKIRIDLKNQKLINRSWDKIQNAGIMVFQDGYARDIGALVRDSQQYYEFDKKQYDLEREVYAACGAAVLYRKKILDKIGLLDESFFMYYEDVEISERARFAGYKNVYSPKAVARHYHALSSKEWSPFFTYHVERGRLMHIFLNFPLLVFFKQYILFNLLHLAFLIKVVFSFRRFFYVVRSRKNSEGETKFQRRIQVIKALLYFIVKSPVLFYKRWKLSRNRPDGAVEANLKKIEEGYWYFNR